MVGQLKEDVAEWYQGLSAHARIEAMCTLIDLSLPFEIRFLGSLIEHLGRKDFGSLREAESRANSFTNGNPDDKKKLIQSLGEVAPLCVGNGTQYVNPLMQSTNFTDSPANRPSPTHLTDSKGHPSSQTEPFQSPDGPGGHGVCSESSSNCHDGVGPKGKPKGASSAPNHVGFSSEEETESMCIVNDLKRRKLILYISVLSPTNHDGANLYYTVLSDIEDNPTPQLAWLEDLDKDAQEEVSLLYTLASRHPAFTFDQRMFLTTVANRVNEMIASKFPQRNSLPHQTLHTHPVYYSHAAIPQGLDAKYSGYYIFAAPPPMHIQQSPHQPTSVPNNGEQIRNTSVATPFPAYTSFTPYFVPHHPPTISHPATLNPPYVMPSCSNNSNSVVTNSSISSNRQLSSPSSSTKSLQTQPVHVPSPNMSNSVSNQNSLSAPSSRTSSVPFRSEQNSVEVDSEESSENCDWNSPESSSSPFESPPQSLTPSRSQSPPTGGISSHNTSVQAVSISANQGSTLVVTSTGNSVIYGGPASNNTSYNNSNSSSSSTTTVKTEIQTGSGLVITTTTMSNSSTDSSTFTTSNGNSGGSSTVTAVPTSSNNGSNNVNSIKTSSPTTSMHHAQLPLHGHHLVSSPQIGTASVRGPSKISTSVSASNNTQSFAIHPQNPAVVSSSMLSVTPQQQAQIIPQTMMSPTVPVHMQQTTISSSNNMGGIVSHSMSSAAVAFVQQSHGAHSNLGLNPTNHPPPTQNSYPCYPHMNSIVSFGGMNAGFRGPAQGVLTRNQFPSPLHNNQIGMKGADMQRGGHNHSLHGSLRQKTQQQNTSKRRGTGSNGGGMVTLPNVTPVVAPVPVPNPSQSTSGKGDEVCDSLKDNRSNEIVVSANPTNIKTPLQQQQDRTSGSNNGGNKPYHHNITNGLTAHPSPSSGAVLSGNQLPNSSTVIVGSTPSQQGPVLINSSNPGGSIGPKVGDDGLLGDGGVGTGMESYHVSQLPYHLNGPQVYGHPGAPFIQIPNGYMTTPYYGNPAMGPPGPPSTEIMMNPSCVPHFSFPFTIPQSFSSSPSSANNKPVNNNTKDKGNSIHGGNFGSGADNKSTHSNTNQHDNNHVTPSHVSGYYRTQSQPGRNNRGVILDIGGGALGSSSLSPVNVDVAVMPPLDELVETIHRPRKISCYNCGLNTHLGPDCKDGSMEEMTRHQFRVNYSGPTSVTADAKDGD